MIVDELPAAVELCTNEQNASVNAQYFEIILIIYLTISILIIHILMAPY